MSRTWWWRRGRCRNPRREARLGRSADLLLFLQRIEPRAHAGHQGVVALDHLHGLAQPRFGGLPAQIARLDLLVGRHPGAVVAPQAGAELALERLPGLGIDGLRAPAVLGHET